ncbi:hypothetical protein KSE_76240t [Kitasatospora setae KM-6054]|uniref:Uncharacterized protein n=1 Tax=Kitasatospora setae (strain ATCC 33774 / DSM 43861 / JCM 3304 / KCC A-0304 / NBRC 14216 / KM-6054) TaxID=452652 RepID=E4MZ08_KITSK|nr:hypothetical protein KSE_00500t [Kitasatospora setae KM-6054]BAJ33377.1 hypothetical protein KSE_76240t [Kitasatospora setae KM-6054]
MARAAALAAAAAALLVPLPTRAKATSAVPGAQASARLIRLNSSAVPAIGLAAFSGTYGTASGPGHGADDQGDFSDPDGVLAHVAVGSGTARTSVSASRDSAQAQLTGLEVRFNSRSLVRVEAGAVGSLDAYASSASPHRSDRGRSPTTARTPRGSPSWAGGSPPGPPGSPSPARTSASPASAPAP